MLKQALEKALEFEKEISLFYLEQGQVATNVLVQKLFLTLSKQEIDHMMHILETSGDLERGASAVEVPPASSSKVEDAMKEFFLKKRHVLKKDASNAEAIEMAIDMEKEGCEMYAQFLSQSSVAVEKQFFSQLLDQENEHLESLLNTHYFLTGTGDWFEKEESRVWSWMNQ